VKRFGMTREEKGDPPSSVEADYGAASPPAGKKMERGPNSRSLAVRRFGMTA